MTAAGGGEKKNIMEDATPPLPAPGLCGPSSCLSCTLSPTRARVRHTVPFVVSTAQRKEMMVVMVEEAGEKRKIKQNRKILAGRSVHTHMYTIHARNCIHIQTCAMSFSAISSCCLATLDVSSNTVDHDLCKVLGERGVGAKNGTHDARDTCTRACLVRDG